MKRVGDEDEKASSSGYLFIKMMVGSGGTMSED